MIKKISLNVFLTFVTFLLCFNLSLADRLNIGPMFQLGMPMNDAISISKIKSEKNRGFLEEFLKNVNSDDINKLVNVPTLHLAFGVRTAYEFGEDFKEEYSIDFEISYLWQRNDLINVKNKVPENNEPRDYDNQSNKDNFTDAYVKLPSYRYQIHIGSINIFAGGRYYFFRGDAVSWFINGGVDIKFNIVLTCNRVLNENGIENLITNNLPDQFKNMIKKELQVSEQEQNKVKDEFSKFNFAPRIGLGVQIFDKILSLNIFAKYWILEEMDITRGKNGEFSEFLGGQIIPIESMKLNRTFDLYTSVELDLMPIFRKNNSEEIT